MKRRLILAVVILTLSACFHTSVSTGITGTTGRMVKKDWSSGWFWGLIGPGTVFTVAACPHGISLVETERSFGNNVASFFTLGIYAPMSIRVYCAAPPKITGVTPAP